MALSPLHSQRPRTAAQTIATARQLVLDGHYVGVDGTAPVELDYVKVGVEVAVRQATMTLSGRAIDTKLTDAAGDGAVETLTILTSLTREDLVHAAVYTVSVPGCPVLEVRARPGTGLWAFASEVTDRVVRG